MDAENEYRVVFPEWYDQVAEWEFHNKGFLPGVELHLQGGDIQRLFFYDPVRLAQDLEMEEKMGAKPFVATPGLIVIPEITRDAILAVVASLMRSGYFPIDAKTGGGLNDVIHLMS